MLGWDVALKPPVPVDAAADAPVPSRDCPQFTQDSESPEQPIEYAGIIKDGKKLIVCQMSVDEDYEYDSEDTDGIDFEKIMVCPKKNGIFEKNGFSGRLDGGCDVVELSYDPKKKEIITLYCNGVA